MFASDDKDVSDILDKSGLPYQSEQLNIDLMPGHKRQYQWVVHFYYEKGQAEILPEVIKNQVSKNFTVLLKIIQLKKLNVKYFYVKIYLEDNNPLLSDTIRDLNSNVLLHDMEWVLDYAIHGKTNPSPLILSTAKKPLYIIEIKFIFTIIEDI